MDKRLEESWNRYRLGDNKALGAIYSEYYIVLKTRAYSFLDDEMKSEDAVQDTFLKFFNYSIQRRYDLPQGDDINLKAYFTRAVNTKCLDILKQEKNRRDILNNVKSSIFSLFTRPLAEESFAEENYNDMLDVLPDRQREILKLHIEGYKNDEIAQSLSVSYNTVRNTISSSKAKIRVLWSTFMD